MSTFYSALEDTKFEKARYLIGWSCKGCGSGDGPATFCDGQTVDGRGEFCLGFLTAVNGAAEGLQSDAREYAIKWEIRAQDRAVWSAWESGFVQRAMLKQEGSTT